MTVYKETQQIINELVLDSVAITSTIEDSVISAWGIAVNPVTGNLFVSQWGDSLSPHAHIAEFTSGGQYVDRWGFDQETARQFFGDSFTRLILLDTGVDADSGAVVGEAIRAHLTVTMMFLKVGFLCFPARSFLGRVRVVDIGIP